MKLVATLVTLVAAFSLPLASQAQPAAWPDGMQHLRHAPSESRVPALLPPDVAVAPVEPSLPRELAHFSGIWRGWACRARVCDVQIAVELLSATGATLVYSGANAFQPPVVQRLKAGYAHGELSARLDNGSRLVVRLRAPSRIDSEMEFSLWRTNGQLASVGVLSRSAAPLLRSETRIPTPWTDGGRPLTLQAVVYQPLTPGPWPTLVFNHGSTGNGDRPEWFTQTWTAPEIASHMVARGWQVVMPQRRGRGTSDGLYDEGFEADRSRYACTPALSLPGMESALSDLDAVMAWLASRPDVDTKRVVIGGVSRGGILSAVYAGTRPASVAGVINFVGGWVGERCWNSNTINGGSFVRAARYAQPMLWIYGDRDPFYSLRHSRANHQAFQTAGGQGELLELDPVPGQNGHTLHPYPQLWQDALDRYLQTVAP